MAPGCHNVYLTSQPGLQEQQAGWNPKDLARFWAKVEKRGPTECWPWIAGATQAGYGQFAIRGFKNGREYAHRFAWIIAHGPIPEGQEVRHGCDNPACVNVAHLQLGTFQDNINDAVERGRFHVPRPTRHKITADQLPEIDALLATRRRGIQSFIAKKYGVTKAWVSQYVHHRRRHFDRPSSRPPAPSQLIQQANPAAPNPLSRRDRPLRAADRAVRIGRGGVALARFGLTAPPLE